MSESLVQKLARLENKIKELEKQVLVAKNPPLTTSEIKQLIISTIDEVVTEPYITKQYRK
jgi:hypothetical protein